VRSRNIFFELSLQFTKASNTATLSQQEKNNSADAQRGGFIPRSDVPSASSSRWLIASRRAHRSDIDFPTTPLWGIWFYD
jgi:hypothetical protein